MIIEELTPIRVISHKIVDQLQIVISAMDQREPRIAITACKRIYELDDQLRAVILGFDTAPWHKT